MEEYCKRCNRDTPQEELIGPFGPHYGKVTCNFCGGTKRFMRKPCNLNKRQANKYLPKDLEISYCQMCLRPKEDLINYEHLVSHHIIQICHDGPDLPENIWVVCNACHSMIHHSRIYYRRASGDYSRYTEKP